MSCNDIEVQLGAYLDEELSADQMRQIGGHVETCSHCRQTLDGFREVKRLGSFLAATPPPVDREEWTPHWDAVKRRLTTGEQPGGLLDAH